jgi:hypothetical protein
MAKRKHKLKERRRVGKLVHTRLFDLVRYMRSELLEAGLITEREYSYVLGEDPLAQGVGSPSPRRLEDYDDIRNHLDSLEEASAMAVMNPNKVHLADLRDILIKRCVELEERTP